ncbi:MAG: 30S ribosomal protein S7 [Parachlamydiales bacterium]|nr:30S ribosomal protein S7 [Parachlamydiales bacterium]
MSRRRRAVKRKIKHDPVYKSLLIEMMINKIMYDGKKSKARTIVYNALEEFAQKVKAENLVNAYEKALENAMPTVEVKSRRIGGATYQVPVEIAPDRRLSLVMRWIITNARNKAGMSMKEGLALELSDCFNNQGSTIKKKEDTHRMAEANKAFAHYKW